MCKCPFARIRTNFKKKIRVCVCVSERACVRERESERERRHTQAHFEKVSCAFTLLLSPQSDAQSRQRLTQLLHILPYDLAEWKNEIRFCKNTTNELRSHTPTPPHTPIQLPQGLEYELHERPWRVSVLCVRWGALEFACGRIEIEI